MHRSKHRCEKLTVTLTDQPIQPLVPLHRHLVVVTRTVPRMSTQPMMRIPDTIAMALQAPLYLQAAGLGEGAASLPWTTECAACWARRTTWPQL